MPEFKKIDTLKERYPGIDEIEHGDLIELQNDIKSMVMDGRVVLQGRDGELLGYEAMYESIFVNNWISQFAINEVNGHRYFNLQAWSEVTDKFTKGVIVVEDGTNIPMFIIPSFIRPNLSNDEGSTLAFYAAKAGHAQNVPDKHQQTQIINGLAARVKEIIPVDGKNRNDYTNMVPNWVYARHGIVPMAMKAMMYIRDVYQPDISDETFNNVEDILKRFYTAQPITESEKKLVLSLTNGEFSFDSIVVDDSVKTTTEKVKQMTSQIDDEEESAFDD